MRTKRKPVAVTTGINSRTNDDTGFFRRPEIITLPAFLQRLDGVRQVATGFVACCPAHDDRNPSLSITPTHDRWLLHCFAGCSIEAITVALGASLSDLFNTENGKRSAMRRRTIPYGMNSANGHKRGGRVSPRRVGIQNYRETGVFVYHDEEGQIIAVKRRYDFTGLYNDGSQRAEKTFVVSPTGCSLPLYRLPAVIAAVRNGHSVYLTEGERKADILETYIRQEWGTNAVATSYGGHWRQDMSGVLAGAFVVIIPDCDNAGKRIAERVISNLAPVAATVALCDLSDLLSALQAGERLQ